MSNNDLNSILFGLLQSCVIGFLTFVIVFVSYILHYDADKVFFILAIFILALAIVNRHYFVRFKNIYFFGLIVATLFVIYVFQLMKFNVLVNNSILELFAMLIFYLVSVNLPNKTRHQILYIFSCFLLVFSLINLRLGGYLLQVKGVGILASYAILIPIFFFSLKRSILSTFLKLTSVLILFLLQVRMPILSWLIFEFYRFSIKKKVLAIIAIVITLPIAFTALGESSRLFSTHTSGRYFIWLKVLKSFNFENNLFFGMGDRAAQKILSTLPSAETFATMHNEYLRVFYDLGVLGILLLAFLCIYGIIQGKGTRKVFPMILALQMFTDNVLTYVSMYLFFMILLINYEPQVRRHENTIVSTS